MIRGEKREKLTPEGVLQKITSYDIFRMYMPDGNWRVNQVTISPFMRGNHYEKVPSFIIGNRTGVLHFCDFGDPDRRGDCFTFVKLLHNIPNMDEVLKKIDNDFGLGIGSSPLRDYKKVIGEYQQPEELGKRYALIQVITRKFNKEELDFWKEYHLDLHEIRGAGIYALSKVYLNKSLHSARDNEIRFGYLYDGGFWKIYTPFAEKKRKWLSNVPVSLSYGLENLDKEHNTLICDSLKDYLVCRKVYPYICQVQNESLAAFSTETISYIKENSKEVFYGGDSDDPGKKASYAITNAFGFRHINPPDYLLKEGIKDFAAWGRSYGIESLREHFIKKGLL